MGRREEGASTSTHVRRSHPCHALLPVLSCTAASCREQCMAGTGPEQVIRLLTHRLSRLARAARWRRCKAHRRRRRELLEGGDTLGAGFARLQAPAGRSRGAAGQLGASSRAPALLVPGGASFGGAAAAPDPALPASARVLGAAPPPSFASTGCRSQLLRPGTRQEQPRQPVPVAAPIGARLQHRRSLADGCRRRQCRARRPSAAPRRAAGVSPVPASHTPASAA